MQISPPNTYNSLQHIHIASNTVRQGRQIRFKAAAAAASDKIKLPALKSHVAYKRNKCAVGYALQTLLYIVASATEDLSCLPIPHLCSGS